MNGLDIANMALQWVGTPYHNRAATKQRGCDCIGLVRGLWAEIYQLPAPELPEYSTSWSAQFQSQELLLEEARRYLVEVDKATRAPGTVMVFRVHPRASAQHCGVLVSNTNMVHAQSGHKVFEVTMGLRWEPKIVAAFQFSGVTY